MSYLPLLIGRIGKAGMAQSSFTPLNVPDLALWLDATDVSTISKSDNIVSQWNNKSKNGNNATQPTASHQPIFIENKINAKPCLMPNANKNSYMTIPNFSFSAITAFAVLRNERIYPCTDNVVDQIFRQEGSPPKSLSSFNGYVGSNDYPSIRTENIGGNLYLNGIQKNDDDNIAADTSMIFSFEANESATTNNLRILGQPGALWAHSGPVGEILIFKRVLSALEHNRIGHYLGRKWGIAWTDI